MVIKSIYKNEYKISSSPMKRVHYVDKFIGKKPIKLLFLLRAVVENSQ